MRDCALIQKCAFVTFRKWTVTPNIWMTAICIVVFGVWNVSWVLDYSYAAGIRITPWILPHFFSMPIMFLVYGFLTIVLFSGAPFTDRHTQFMEVRVGKRIWILGQFCYILESSAVYTIFYYLVSVLIILPRIYLSLDWGMLITNLAYNSSAAYEYGIMPSGIFFSSNILENFSPIEATLLTLLFLWLVSSLLGMIIFACHIAFRKGSGIIVTGFFVFLSYFSNYIGPMIFGNQIFNVAFVNWISLIYLNIYDMPDLLSIPCAGMILVIGIMVFGLFGIISYCKKDA